MRERLRNSRWLYYLYTKLYRLTHGNRIKTGKNNIVKLDGVKLQRCRISVEGEHNTIELHPHSLLVGCNIVIHGNHCAVSIGSGLNATDLLLWCEDDESSIHIGKDAIIAGATQLAATEGKKIVIGDNLLCSNAVTVRTGDSHSIYDENGTRVNHAKDVVIGSHVWVGNQVIILKGSSIGDESVVGSGAIVTGSTEPRVVLAGNPARIVKRKITWDFAR